MGASKQQLPQWRHEAPEDAGQVEAGNTGAGFDDDESIATNNSDGDDEAPADKTES